MDILQDVQDLFLHLFANIKVWHLHLEQLDREQNCPGFFFFAPVFTALLFSLQNDYMSKQLDYWEHPAHISSFEKSCENLYTCARKGIEMSQSKCLACYL